MDEKPYIGHRRGKVGDNSIHIEGSIAETLAKKFAPYSFQVGILQDGPHYAPAERFKSGKRKGQAPPLKTFAGGPARRQSRVVDGTLSSVSQDFRKFLGFNYLTKPFEKRTPEYSNWIASFFSMALGSGKLRNKKRCENFLQAIVRNPILGGKYGRNRRATIKKKGFDRKGIDTAQFFKAIRAKVRISLNG